MTLLYLNLGEFDKPGTFRRVALDLSEADYGRIERLCVDDYSATLKAGAMTDDNYLKEMLLKNRIVDVSLNQEGPKITFFDSFGNKTLEQQFSYIRTDFDHTAKVFLSLAEINLITPEQAAFAMRVYTEYQALLLPGALSPVTDGAPTSDFRMVKVDPISRDALKLIADLTKGAKVQGSLKYKEGEIKFDDLKNAIATTQVAR